MNLLTGKVRAMVDRVIKGSRDLPVSFIDYKTGFDRTVYIDLMEYRKAYIGTA